MTAIFVVAGSLSGISWHGLEPRHIMRIDRTPTLKESHARLISSAAKAWIPHHRTI